MPKCLAKKYSGGLCQNNAIIGKARCKYHGGLEVFDCLIVELNCHIVTIGYQSLLPKSALGMG